MVSATTVTGYIMPTRILQPSELPEGYSLLNRAIIYQMRQDFHDLTYNWKFSDPRWSDGYIKAGLRAYSALVTTYYLIPEYRPQNLIWPVFFKGFPVFLTRELHPLDWTYHV